MREHRKICYSCTKAIRNPQLYCDQGWEMAKRESRANYQLRKFKDTDAKGQGTLW